MKAKVYHFYFFILKFIILLFIGIISLKFIVLDHNLKNNIMTSIDGIFKLSIGIFMIIFFSNNNCNFLNIYDRILLVLSGFILIILIDIKPLFNNNTINNNS